LEKLPFDGFFTVITPDFSADFTRNLAAAAKLKEEFPEKIQASLSTMPFCEPQATIG